MTYEPFKGDYAKQKKMILQFKQVLSLVGTVLY